MMGDDWRSTVYSRYLSVHYGRINRLDEDGYREAESNYSRMWDPVLPEDRGVHCLDLGCGPGQFMWYLRSKGFKNVEGVDRSPENVSAARSMGLNVEESDALDHLRRRHARGQMFGLVAVMDFLEHLRRQEVFALLEQVHQVLEEQGSLLIKTINASSLLGAYYRYIDVTHEIAFTEESLGETLRSLGYSRIDFLDYRWSRWPQRLRSRVKRLVYWGLYRVLEGRRVPRAIDHVLIVAARK